ncbi:MAG: hypothetical protein MJ231_01410 [bacterium]|nr:hypothetical protein [bacterium]
MLAAYTESEQNTCFQLLGAKSLLGSTSRNDETISISLLDSVSSEDCGDYCSFASMFSEPSESALMTFAESSEACGSIAYSGSSESCGSIAYSGSSESFGSIASSGVCSGSACSYSC